MGKHPTIDDFPPHLQAQIAEQIGGGMAKANHVWGNQPLPEKKVKTVSAGNKWKPGSENAIPAPSEDDIQESCITWFRMAHEELYWHLYAIPNGGKRHPAEEAKLKRTGTLAGTWDLHLCIPKGIYAGLYIEMKTDKNGLTDNQIAFREANKVHYKFIVCHSRDEFKEAIESYLLL